MTTARRALTPDRLGSMTALRWGILATGGIAHSFMSDLRVAERDVVAVASRTQESADAFAAEFGIPRAHGSWADLAADPDVDIVYIATPHPQHAEPALLMIEAGKHVLIEKAFTVNAAEAARIGDAAAAKGVLAMEAMWTRYLPHMIRIREILAAGTLGEVRSLTADHTQAITADPAHRLNALELGGGALLDLGIYPISFTWDVFGRPDRILAAARKMETGADEELATIFTYPGGQIATTYSSSRTKGRNTATILGTDARIEIAGVWYAKTSFQVIANDGTVLESYESDYDGRGLYFEALAAERLVAAGELGGDILTIDETVAIMACLDEIRSQIGLVYPGESTD